MILCHRQSVLVVYLSHALKHEIPGQNKVIPGSLNTPSKPVKSLDCPGHPWTVGNYAWYLKVSTLNSRFFDALLKVPLCLGLATLQFCDGLGHSVIDLGHSVDLRHSVMDLRHSVMDLRHSVIDFRHSVDLTS